MASHSPFRAALLAGLFSAGLGAALGAGPAHAQPMERAREALAKGDLRAAQIEYRNAVRAEPNSAAARAALAGISLDLGDGDTAEKEARAALERGYDPAQGTRLLLRAYLLQNRARDLLRDFPVPDDPSKAAVGGQIAAARTLAQLSLNDRNAARESAAVALRLAPNAVEPNLAAAAIAFTNGDRAAAEAAIDKALTIDPTSTDALLRKASLQFERGEAAPAAATLARLLAKAPGNVPARVLRAEALLRSNEPAKAREEVDAALRTQPNSAPAAYLLAVMLVQAQNWKGADEIFQKLGPALPNFPDGFLLQAITKRALNQTAQALDSAQRYAARRPEDPRGAKFLASLELEGNRPDEAVAALNRFISRGTPDAEAYDLLGRAHAAAGRPRDAAAALLKASELAPKDPGIMGRLAASRLAAGDTSGSTQAAEGVLALVPNQPGAREMLAVAALTRGDLTLAESELGKLDAAARASEVGSTLIGALKLARLDMSGARTAFEAAIKANPESVSARLGLARVAAAQNLPEETDRLLTEALQRDPTNAEAVTLLANIAGSTGPRAAAAKAALEKAQASRPTDQRLALVVAGLLSRAGEHAKAIAVLDAEPLRGPGRGAALPLARAQAYAADNRWAEAETASRAALAEAPDNVFARRQLAALLVRKSDAAGAETLVREGLRAQPADAQLQQTLVGLVQQARGLDAALAVADELAKQPAAQPASRLLRGDLLLAAQRPADAAKAFAAAYTEAPSALLALRRAGALRAANQPAEATAALNAWLQKEPENTEILDALAQLDIQAGRLADAEKRLGVVVAKAPGNAVALNNLAWLIGERGPSVAAQARTLAERAYFLLPNVETADTLGWILARNGDPKLAVPLLRAAAAARGNQPTGPVTAYHLAFALRAAGEREDAIKILEQLVAPGITFPERADAEKLLAELKAKR
jgi:putative PEP-CTERM system TPR-repeat lipoprotein